MNHKYSRDLQGNGVLQGLNGLNHNGQNTGSKKLALESF
jgi:hypothetical protein